MNILMSRNVWPNASHDGAPRQKQNNVLVSAPTAFAPVSSSGPWPARRSGDINCNVSRVRAYPAVPRAMPDIYHRRFFQDELAQAVEAECVDITILRDTREPVQNVFKNATICSLEQSFFAKLQISRKQMLTHHTNAGRE